MELAGDHRLVDGRAAFEHDAIHRDFVTRTNAQAIACMDVVERNLLIAAVVLDAARGLGREIEEGADRT